MKAVVKRWYVYIVRCADGTLYTGVAIDIARRIAQHNGVQANGARYTRSRRPVRLVYQEKAPNRSAACKREYAIKQLTRSAKTALINAPNVPLKRAESSQKRHPQSAAAPHRAAALPLARKRVARRA